MSVSPSARRKARQLLLQALYQWQLAGADIATIEAEFRTDNNMAKVDGEFFSELLHQIPKNLDTLDAAYANHLDRALKDLDPISLALLRMGTYELVHRIDIPYKVAINEAVSLAKKFGPTEAHKYINGVLDKVAVQHRALEIKADPSFLSFPRRRESRSAGLKAELPPSRE